MSESDTSDDALYLYAIAGDKLPADWSARGLTTDRDARAVAVGDKGLRAVVQDVDRETWTGPEAEERLRDLAWVGPRAQRHEALVEELDDRLATFPVRFGTLFSGREELVEALEDATDAITEYLREAADHQEWSVRGYLDRDAAREAHSNRMDAQRADSGTSYLKKRAKRQNGSAGDLDQWLRERAESLWEHFREASADGAVRSTAERPDASEETAFHWAFWVSDDQLAGLRDRVRSENDRLEGTGLELELDGPWPGYSFRPDLDAEGSY